MKTIQVYSDSGHSWAKVELRELYKLNIVDKISSFSYVRQQSFTSGLKVFAYLEEDSDLTAYLVALELSGIKYKFKESHTNRQSKIRNYKHFDSAYYVGLINKANEALRGF